MICHESFKCNEESSGSLVCSPPQEIRVGIMLIAIFIGIDLALRDRLAWVFGQVDVDSYEGGKCSVGIHMLVNYSLQSKQWTLLLYIPPLSW